VGIVNCKGSHSTVAGSAMFRLNKGGVEYEFLATLIQITPFSSIHLPSRPCFGFLKAFHCHGFVVTSESSTYSSVFEYSERRITSLDSWSGNGLLKILQGNWSENLARYESLRWGGDACNLEVRWRENERFSEELRLFKCRLWLHDLVRQVRT
jgi:hypothetical protein